MTQVAFTFTRKVAFGIAKPVINAVIQKQLENLTKGITSSSK